MATNPNQGKTFIGVKLDEFSASLKKMANDILRSETLYISEPQMMNRLLGTVGKIGQLKSLEEDEGEVFISVIKDVTDIFHSIGEINYDLRGQSLEERRLR